MEQRLDLLETGLIYRNPKPYLRAVNAWHPSLLRLDDGALLATFDLGQGPESLDYATYQARSHDKGATWSEPRRLFIDSVQPSTHTARLSRVCDGRIIAMGTRFHRPDPEEGIVNHTNHGFVAMDVIMLESHDDGATWDGPRVVQPPLVGPGFEACHPVLDLGGGRWLWPTSLLAGWDGVAPSGHKSVAFVSHDNGATWPEYMDTFADPSGNAEYWEQSIVRMPGGRLVALAWALEVATGKPLPSPYMVSHDGRQFTPQRPTGFQAQTAKLLPLCEDRLLCVYRRVDEVGLWGTLVELRGDEWRNLITIPLWQGAATGMMGVGSKSDELSALKFGYPSMQRLTVDTVLVAFWCCEDGIFNIRWLRLTV